jgi:hypothetical protein
MKRKVILSEAIRIADCAVEGPAFAFLVVILNEVKDLLLSLLFCLSSFA